MQMGKNGRMRRGREKVNQEGGVEEEKGESSRPCQVIKPLNHRHCAYHGDVNTAELIPRCPRQFAQNLLIRAREAGTRGSPTGPALPRWKERRDCFVERHILSSSSLGGPSVRPTTAHS
ncbi:hypothetical protein E2C01_007958 [Portunus trituberculatus]|uniref:Uncharacterized protein n=1 Tax=Portunus trituberculatus TaxID=210409 RepID=A0A5B7D2M4_PORTR|nr:hypothetical protein [Portunus trituberculatus]